MTLKFSEFEYKPIDIEKVKKDFEEAIKEFRNAKNSKKQIELIYKMNEYGNEISTSMSLCNVRFTINTADKYYAQENDRLDEISPIIQDLSTRFYKEI